MMDALISTKDAPLSPWAARFPLTNNMYTAANGNHSAFAPEVPRINDPKYYDQNPVVPQASTPLEFKSMDRLFLTEWNQSQNLLAIRTWEAAVLNRYLLFAPGSGRLSGGHQLKDGNKPGFIAPNPLPMSDTPSPILQALLQSMQKNEERDFAIYLQERIKVDETKWLPFLRKGRWFDWIQVSEGFEQPAGRTWTVDDEKIWEVLSVILELVNRMLEALIEDKHEGLQTMIWGRIDYWERVADIFGQPRKQFDSVLLSYRTEQMISQQRKTPCDWDFIPTMTPQQWRDRLIRVLDNLIWSFSNTNATAEALTNRWPVTSASTADSAYTAVIVIPTAKFETMFNTDLTLGELCMYQVGLATSMMHEIMHALVWARASNDNYIGNKCHEETEPFLEASGVAETGHYMDNLFFGGTIFLYPYTQRGISAPPITMVVREFPWPKCTKSRDAAPNCPGLAPGDPITMIHVPSLWASQLLSEEFWQTPGLKKSDNFFHRPKVFVSETPNTCSYYHQVKLRVPPPQQYHRAEDDMVMQEWKERQRIWDTFRQGWYKDAYLTWSTSPWGLVRYRRYCDDFAVAFERKDLVICTDIANKMVNIINWRTDKQTYLDALPTSSRTPWWAIHAIGLLMMASIPRAHRPLTHGLGPESSYQLELTPGKRAAAEGYSAPVWLPARHNYSEPIHHAKPIDFYDYFSRNGKDVDWAQIDCLRLVRRMTMYIESKKGVVHKHMLDAIHDALKSIRLDRQDIVLDYPDHFSHTSKWSSSWFFKFPPYDPLLLVLQGQNTGLGMIFN
ncbi:hypothetical protein F4803DRAFT_540977 [Xylaria telfairii]|nr:hypothetical protein F4803DRAFT_540977 [Xylaria telfairii]